MKSPSVSGKLRTIVLLTVVLALSGCDSLKGQATLDKPEGIPLEEFIIGRWKYEGEAYYIDYGPVDIDWEYTFEDGNVLKIWTGADGGTCRYEFVGMDRVLVDCRPRDLDTWIIRVEREGQSLLMHTDFVGTIRFERIDPNAFFWN